MTTTKKTQRRIDSSSAKRRPNRDTIPVGPPIAPAIISRVPVFQPSFKRLALATMTHETPWGTVTVQGRLGGVHRKVLDAIFADNIKAHRLDTGACAFLIDPYRIEKTANIAANPRWLLGIFEDMRQARVELFDKITGLRHWAGILSEYHESPRARAHLPGGALTGDRPLYAVVISSAWMRVYDTSLIVKYKRLLPEINAIREGAVHAFVLHVLTHEAGIFRVDEALAHIGAFRAGTSDRHRRRIRAALVAESDRLEALGIHIYTGPGDKLMASYHPRPEVHFQNPRP